MGSLICGPYLAGRALTPDDPLGSCLYRVAAEQKARTTYDNILRLVKDPDVCAPIKFLRAREIVHFQRFGEADRKDHSELITYGHSVLAVRHMIYHISELEGSMHMSSDERAASPAGRIDIDKMQLTITDISPVFRKMSEQEARQEIGRRLWQVFQRYGTV